MTTTPPIPPEDTPERAAWEIVVAWAQEDDELGALRRELLGRSIHARFPKLIARIAAALSEQLTPT